MDELDNVYVVLLNPQELVKYFKDDAEFENWCETGEVFDLSETLKVFESHEMYEHCAIIKKVMDQKIDMIDLCEGL